MNIFRNIAAISMSILILNACDIIEENERLVEIQQVPANKTAIIIEFTDQRCVNCPAAAELIEGLHEEYKDKLISVSLHANPIFVLPLETETANLYENFFQVNLVGHPAAMIDGAVNLSPARDQWATMLRNEIQKEAKAELTLHTELDEANNQITVFSSVRGIDFDNKTDLHLQLWMVEDSIISKQLMEDGKYNYEYMHRHVFRSTINDTWGKAFPIETGNIFNDTTSIHLQTEWNKSNLYVVGFVYSGNNYDKIIQATQIKIK